VQRNQVPIRHTPAPVTLVGFGSNYAYYGFIYYYIQLYFIANDSKKKRIIIRATHRNNNKINVIVNDTPASVVVSMNIV